MIDDFTCVFWFDMRFLAKYFQQKELPLIMDTLGSKYYARQQALFTRLLVSLLLQTDEEKKKTGNFEKDSKKEDDVHEG